MHGNRLSVLMTLLLVALLAWGGCGGSDENAPPGKRNASEEGNRGGRARAGGDRPDGGDGGGTAIPVEVALIERRSVSSFLETNGTLEAENEVDLVARTQGPVVELAAEEGMRVKKGDLLVKLDETEQRAQLEIAKVALEEARRSYDRAKQAVANEIISQEVYDTALGRLESAQAQVAGSEILLDYTSVVAPFDAIVIERYVKFAQNVSPNQALFRISDFDPLLCRIQVPEKELSRLELNQRAYLRVEAWPGERFEARVLRISPVVDATTGTIRVTLEVRTFGKLSPGMFASVFVVTDTHQNALVMPRRALSLESLRNTVFISEDGKALRRDVELGYEESDLVEVLSGLEEGDRVIVVGQDGLTNETPVQVVKGPGAEESSSPGAPVGQAGARPPSGEREGPSAMGGGGRPGGRKMDFSTMTPEQLERAKARMRERGMSDEEIANRIGRRSEQP